MTAPQNASFSAEHTVYRELRPPNVYDMVSVETWLEDLSASGYHLTGFKGDKGIFEKGEPKQWRYRMQLLSRKEEAPPPERIAEQEQLGWIWAATWDRRFHIWKSSRVAASLDPAPGLEAADFARLRRNLLWTHLLSFLLLSAFLAVMFALLRSTSTPLKAVICSNPPGTAGLLLLDGVFVLFLLAQEVVSGLHLFRRLEDREPLERPRPYLRQKWMARGSYLVGLTLAVSGLLGCWLDAPWSAWDRHGAVPKADAVYADLCVIEGAAEEDVFFFGPKTKVHELAPRMWFIRQYSDPDTPEETQSILISEYYHLLTRHLTPRLEGDLRSEYDLDELEAVSCDALDSFWWGTRTTQAGTEQIVIAASGRNILHLQYRGSADLRTQSSYFAELLNS